MEKHKNRDKSGKFISNKPKPKPKTKKPEEPVWSIYSEVNFVKKLGLGIHSPGSDLRHKQDWWLKQYLKATEGMTTDYILAGRHQAKFLLSEMDVKAKQ